MLINVYRKFYEAYLKNKFTVLPPNTGSMQDLVEATEYRHFTKSKGNLYEFYLTGEIVEASYYAVWFDTIRNAGFQDTIKIYINSGGGSVDTALQFLSVMGETQAEIICSVEGACMSAATMIFLQGDILEVAPHSTYMFHNYAGGAFGKGGELYDQINFERTWSRRLLEDVYEYFLTPAEIDQMLDNKDIWMDGEEVKKRVLALTKQRQAQAAAAEAATQEISA